MREASLEFDPLNGTLCRYSSALSNAASFGHAATPRKDRGDESRAEGVLLQHDAAGKPGSKTAWQIYAQRVLHVNQDLQSMS